jgi:hypothetical protein
VLWVYIRLLANDALSAASPEASRLPAYGVRPFLKEPVSKENFISDSSRRRLDNGVPAVGCKEHGLKSVGHSHPLWEARRWYRAVHVQRRLQEGCTMELQKKCQSGRKKPVALRRRKTPSDVEDSYCFTNQILELLDGHSAGYRKIFVDR